MRCLYCCSWEFTLLSSWLRSWPPLLLLRLCMPTNQPGPQCDTTPAQDSHCHLHVTLKQCLHVLV